ncbi:MAG: hypothetical protein WC373_14330 [Smithella sp.]|jgi:hypothetical protein
MDKQLTVEDFKILVPAELVECLNKIDGDTKDLEQRFCFLKDHNFHREAEYLETKIRERTSIYVHLCNALGKYF